MHFSAEKHIIEEQRGEFEHPCSCVIDFFPIRNVLCNVRYSRTGTIISDRYTEFMLVTGGYEAGKLSQQQRRDWPWAFS